MALCHCPSPWTIPWVATPKSSRLAVRSLLRPRQTQCPMRQRLLTSAYTTSLGCVGLGRNATNHMGCLWHRRRRRNGGLLRSIRSTQCLCLLIYIYVCVNILINSIPLFKGSWHLVLNQHLKYVFMYIYKHNVI